MFIDSDITRQNALSHTIIDGPLGMLTTFTNRKDNCANVCVEIKCQTTDQIKLEFSPCIMLRKLKTKYCSPIYETLYFISMYMLNNLQSFSSVFVTSSLFKESFAKINK